MPPFLELQIRTDKNLVSIEPRDDKGNYEPYKVPASHDVQWFKEKFAEPMYRAARMEKESLPQEFSALGSEAFHKVFQGNVLVTYKNALNRLRTNSPLALLPLRFKIESPELRQIPWEGMLESGRFNFLATSDNVVTSRIVPPDDQAPARMNPGNGPLRLCLLSPLGVAIDTFKASLREYENQHQIQLFGPLKDKFTQLETLEQSLRDVAGFHILHFVGHGDAHENGPRLRLADDIITQEPVWQEAENVADQVVTALRDSGFGPPWLAYLDSCLGAVPAKNAYFDWPSAAEVFVKKGAATAIGHLFPIEDGAARKLAQEFYRHLFDRKTGNGDVAESMRRARIALRQGRYYPGFMLSPVVYLSGEQTKIVELQPLPAPNSEQPLIENAPPPNLPAEVTSILDAGFTLVLGDEGEAGRSSREALRADLIAQLRNINDYNPANDSLSVLCQRFDVVFPGELQTKLEEYLTNNNPEPPLVSALAKHAQPGVHISLLWVPLLEFALAKAHPGKRVLAIYPADVKNPEDFALRIVASQWNNGALTWTEVKNWRDTETLPSNAYIVLRPYGGRIATGTFWSTLRKEDDYVERLIKINAIWPEHWDQSIRTLLQNRAMLFLGTSALWWNHRGLFRALLSGTFDKKRSPLTHSVAIMDAPISDLEKKFWANSQAVFPGVGLSRLHAPERPPRPLNNPRNPQEELEENAHWTQNLAQWIHAHPLNAQVQR